MLVKVIQVFNKEEIKKYLIQIFGIECDLYNPKSVVKDTYIYVRLLNGNSFSIKINNEVNKFEVELRRKYTSLEPDMKYSCNIEGNSLESVINYIKDVLEKINHKSE